MKNSSSNSKSSLKWKGLSEDRFGEIKASFDLFDTDRGGCIDSKGTFLLN